MRFLNRLHRLCTAPRRALVALGTVLCLIGAQQGAVWHELSHFAKRDGAAKTGTAKVGVTQAIAAGVVAVNVGADTAAETRQPNPQDDPPHSRSCDKCAHYAELVGGSLPVAGWRISIDDAAATVSTASRSFSPALAVAAYAARAPPALL